MVASEAAASFGVLLREHRRAAGLTQEQLADRAGVSPRSISELERGGRHVPRRDTVALLAGALGLPANDRRALEVMVDRRRGSGPEGELDESALNQAPQPAERAIQRPEHNLPRSLTSFVGREHELRELARVLPTVPLLTLVGAGGVGKTRLAQELVRNHVASYADGGWLVELAGLGDPLLVPGAVAAAVGMRDLRARNVANTLSEHLGPKHLLLLLDNCEHLIEACAELVAHLLRACPYLQVLATSREPLAIAGETIWRVPPLELPDLRQPLSVDQIASTAAVRLFVERARAVNKTLVANPDNAAAIARICVRVDGIPLALELAAARARVLTMEQLAERLEYDPTLLASASRTGLPQHQTIRATIDWSHDLLGEQEQVLLRRLSVFAGGWTLETAETVCSGSGIERGDVLDLLTQLLDKSMAMVDARNTVARYRLLEPIRQYALERLELSGEANALHARHATALLELAEAGEADLFAGPDEIASLERLEADHDNLRAALRWTLDHWDNEASLRALRASAGLSRFWDHRGYFQEGCAWLEEALAAAGDAPARYRCKALNALAALCWGGGDAPRAQPIAEQALVVSREAEDTRGVAWALLSLGMIAHYQDRAGLALAWLEECVPYARQSGHVALLSLALTFLGRVLLWAKGPQDERAAGALEESLALALAARSRYATGHALLTLGDILWQQGDAERAIPLWQRALEVRWQLADARGTAGCLERLALGLAASDQFEPAAYLFGAAAAQRNKLGLGLRHDVETDHAHLVAVARQNLGAAFAAAWVDGQASTVDGAVTRALEGTRWRLDGRPSVTTLSQSA